MTAPVSAEAAAAEGYTLSPTQAAEMSTLSYVRVLRAITGANGPRLGAACPPLPAMRVRLPNAPPGYCMRPSDLEDWLMRVWEPWPPPADPIDSAEALAILNRGVPLPADSPEYKRVLARLGRDAELSRWQLLGQKRYSRAELERLAAADAERGVTVEHIAQTDKGRRRVPSHMVDTKAAGVILGKGRRSRKPLDEVTVTRWAADGLIPAVKLAGRWWFDPKALKAAELHASEPKRGEKGEILGSGGGKVLVGCNASGCGKVLKRSWSAVHDIRDGQITERPFVYCSMKHAREHYDQCAATGHDPCHCWFRSRTATITVPCTCVLADGSTCGRLARVRIGREHQIRDEWVRCGRCRKAGRWPAENGEECRRPRSGRDAQSKTRKEAFAAVKAAAEQEAPIPEELLWAQQQRERMATLADELLQSPKRMAARGKTQRGRPLTVEEWRETRRRAKSRAAGGSGRPRTAGPPAHHIAWAQRHADILDYYERVEGAGEAMPTPRRLCLEVALEDHADHPERWDYDPRSLSREAADRVAKALKALQKARSES